MWGCKIYLGKVLEKQGDTPIMGIYFKGLFPLCMCYNRFPFGN
jgi:hypothetical protein